MTFIQNTLGKKLEDLFIQDLQDFFKIEREESELLEFKSGGVDINDIYREICAFLNTNGGVLIIGAPLETYSDKKQTKVCIGNLTPSKLRNKEWLLHKISVNVSPFPNDIKIKEFLTPEGNYFILDIPVSPFPPHQSNTEGKYYIRFNKEARPAPHGIVEALFYKRQKAHLITDYKMTILKKGEKLNLEFSMNNQSDFPAENVNYYISCLNILKGRITNNGKELAYSRMSDELTLHDIVKQPIIQDMPVTINLEITTKGEPFLIHFIVWNLQSSKYEICGIFDVENESFIQFEKGKYISPSFKSQIINTMKEISNNL